MIKKILLITTLIFTQFLFCAYSKPDVYVINASKNAALHNELGLKENSEGNYYGAIEEFGIAVALNPNTQASAVYYNNMGETYMKLGMYKEAQTCFENSITLFSLNFLYYQNLVKTFKLQGILPKKISEYRVKSERNSLSMIILGLLYLANGNRRAGIIKLDEFCMKEPDLIITPAIRNYLLEITRQ